MKKLLIISAIITLAIAAQAQVFNTTPNYQTVTIDSTIFTCKKNQTLAFVAQGNDGEYAQVVFKSSGTVLGDTVRVWVGYPFNIVTPGRSNNNATVFLGTLTNWITATGDTTVPRVLCYGY